MSYRRSAIVIELATELAVSNLKSCPAPESNRTLRVFGAALITWRAFRAECRGSVARRHRDFRLSENEETVALRAS